MSTRSGEFVTLRELRGEVGNDACRFFYALRKSDQHLDFDLDLAKSQTNENPVYYIQYAHARICSVIAQWDGDLTTLAEARLELLANPRELAIANKLAEFRDVIENAARELAPHMIAFYLKDLAGEFHGWYNAERMLVDDAALRDARVALAAAVRQVIRNGLAILGVSCPESM
jgi:arginyl-tRNA synthetase